MNRDTVQQTLHRVVWRVRNLHLSVLLSIEKLRREPRFRIASWLSAHPRET
jgi:hypothetical protein